MPQLSTDLLTDLTSSLSTPDSHPGKHIPHHQPAKDFLLFVRRNKPRRATCFLDGILLVFLEWLIIPIAWVVQILKSSFFGLFVWMYPAHDTGA